MLESVINTFILNISRKGSSNSQVMLTTMIYSLRSNKIGELFSIGVTDKGHFKSFYAGGTVARYEELSHKCLALNLIKEN